MNNPSGIQSILEKHSREFYPVLNFNKAIDKVAHLNLSSSNDLISAEVYNDVEKFSAWINLQRSNAGARYLLGGYKENRTMYRHSELFTSKNEDIEPRTLHLGIDVWAAEGTTVYAPLGGMIHSFAYNNHFGDYGVTIILQHQLDTINFYTLYGHLSLKDLEKIPVGKFITRGTEFAHFGSPEENGQWPPHLHFQLIMDMSIWEGDYPGVCKISEAAKYLANSPDPGVLLGLPAVKD